MIEEIVVSDFQSLEDVRLSLGNFTVVVGPSNSGKSAIRRAIEALVSNAAATGHLRHGSGQMETTITYDGNHVVQRVKGSKKNSYHVDALEIAKPGAKAPPAVTEALRLHPINFASQFDQPYLLAETPSEAAKALGELTNIATLFEAIREASRRKREREGTAKTLTEQSLKLSEQLTGFTHLAEEKVKLDAAHTALQAAWDADGRWQALYNAGDAAEDVETRRSVAWNVIAGAQNFDDVVGMVEAAEALLQEAASYEHMLSVVYRHEQVRNETSWAQGVSVTADLAAVEEAAGRAASLHHLVENAHGFMAKASTYANDAAVLMKEIKDLEYELNTFDACPLCGSTEGSLVG